MLPLVNRQFSVAEVGLPLFTLVIGLLDGFNPSSMWVLILMILMLSVVGTFLAIKGMAYFAFMAAWPFPLNSGDGQAGDLSLAGHVDSAVNLPVSVLHGYASSCN